MPKASIIPEEEEDRCRKQQLCTSFRNAICAQDWDNGWHKGDDSDEVDPEPAHSVVEGSSREMPLRIVGGDIFGASKNQLL